LSELPTKNGQTLSWPMVVLILATGAGNFWATKEGTKEGTNATGANRQEIDTVLRQLGELSTGVAELKKDVQAEQMILKNLQKEQPSEQ
jgi:ligand-binding sensor domain-containing protein